MTDEFEEPEEANGDELTFDEILDGLRPERYDTDDLDWMEPGIAKMRDEFLQRGAEEIAEEYARRLAHVREGVATRRLNALFRRFKDGEVSLGFGEGPDWKRFYDTFLRAPLLIGSKKVQLAAATAADMEEWIVEKRRANERDHIRREEIVAGAVALLALLRRVGGVGRVDDLQIPPPE